MSAYEARTIGRVLTFGEKQLLQKLPNYPFTELIPTDDEVEFLNSKLLLLDHDPTIDHSHSSKLLNETSER